MTDVLFRSIEPNMNASTKVFNTVELVEHIFQYLPWYDTYQLRMISDATKYAFQTTIKEIDGEALPANISSADACRELFDALGVKGFRNLQKLDVSTQCLLSRSVEPLLKFCPNLKQLGIKRVHVEEEPQDPLFFFLLYSEKIRHLCIDCRHPKYFTNSDMFELHMVLPQLTTLELIGCAITDLGLSEIAESNKQLVHLNVSGCEDITDRGVTEVLISMLTLKILNVSNTWTMRIRPQTIKRYCENLRALNVWNTLIPQEYVDDLHEWFSNRFETYTFIHEENLNSKDHMTLLYGPPHRIWDDVEDDTATVYEYGDHDFQIPDIDDLSLSSSSSSSSQSSTKDDLEGISESEYQAHNREGRSRFLISTDDPEYEFCKMVNNNKHLQQDDDMWKQVEEEVWEEQEEGEYWDEEEEGNEEICTDDTQNHVDNNDSALEQEDNIRHTHMKAIQIFYSSILQNRRIGSSRLNPFQGPFDGALQGIHVCPGCSQVLGGIDPDEICPGYDHMIPLNCNPACLRQIYPPVKLTQNIADVIKDDAEIDQEPTPNWPVKGVDYVEVNGAMYYDIDSQICLLKEKPKDQMLYLTSKPHPRWNVEFMRPGTLNEVDRNYFLPKELFLKPGPLNEVERNYFLPKERLIRDDRVTTSPKQQARRNQSLCCIN